MKTKLKEYLANLIVRTRLRWQMNGWKYRLELISKIGIPIVAGLIGLWLLAWFYLGPPSVKIDDVKVDLDRSLSIAGPDKNDNGIRDDVDLYIKTLAEKKGYDAPQVRAMEQVAQSLQADLVVDLTSPRQIARADNNGLDASHCLFLQFNGGKGRDAYDLYKKEKAITLNTKVRVMAHLKYNHMLNGTTSELPQKDTCEK